MGRIEESDLRPRLTFPPIMDCEMRDLPSFHQTCLSRPCALTMCAVALMSGPRLEASGSYRHSGLPQAGLSAIDEGLEVEKFELGRRLYAGMLRLPEPDTKITSDQGDRLQVLIKRLPSSQSKSADRLAQLAGRLTDLQLQALEYFVEERFLNTPAAKRRAS